MPSKILVADDSPTIRNIAQSLLRKHGYEVLSAVDGVEALRIAKASRPDLVFLDDSMPVMDGGQVLKELRHDPDLKDIPVVMLLSRDEAETKQRFEQMGTGFFIAKPLNPVQFLDQVEKLLTKQKASFSREEKLKPEGILTGDLGKPDTLEHVEITLPEGEEKSDDDLDIVENSDLMKDAASLSRADEEAAHGFEWFLDELKKETRAKASGAKDAKAKPDFPEHGAPDKTERQRDESEAGKPSEDERNFDEFVKELKYDQAQENGEKAPQVERSVIENMSPSHLDQLVLGLTQRIPRRVAQEVAEMVTPELLERIVREELARIRKHST
jgi:CheY-like chemotaxis protein